MRAVVSHMIYENTDSVEVVTKSSQNVGEVRLYVGVPHKVESGMMHDSEQKMKATEDARHCTINTVCWEWDVGPEKPRECCRRSQCCNLE